MIYLDMTLEEFFKDKSGLKRYAQKLCIEHDYPFEKIKPFITKKSYGVVIDAEGEGLITAHRPHNQELWNPIRQFEK